MLYTSVHRRSRYKHIRMVFYRVADHTDTDIHMDMQTD